MRSSSIFRTLVPVALAAAALAPCASAAGTLRIQSWNSRHMGWSGQTNWSGYAAQCWDAFGSTAGSTNGLDVIAFQEVMYDTSVTSMVSALNAVSGVTWAATYTAPIGRTSYKERYAVLYRTDRVSLLDSSTWNDVGDQFEREPQIVKLRFTTTGADVTLINWHAIFGTNAERQAEIAAIAGVYSSVQSASGSDQDVVLLGDHNKEATSTWWNGLTSLSPAVGWKVNDLTSLNSSCAYASAYDHFWFQSSYVTEYSSSGRDFVADTCALYAISDHAPVWLKLYSTGDDD